MLIEHSLDFQNDWKSANASFTMTRFDASGNLLPENFTSTGHIQNHFTVGPAILWAPFLIVAHAGVLLSDALGAHIPPDGFSWPYVYAMAIATAVYGFLGLWISFRLARHYFSESAAFVATLGIWFATLAAGLYVFQPVVVPRTFGLRRRTVSMVLGSNAGGRSLLQWIVLGLLTGLALDVYYPNFVIILLPGVESLAVYAGMTSTTARKQVALRGRKCWVRCRSAGWIFTDADHAVDYLWQRDSKRVMFPCATGPGCGLIYSRYCFPPIMAY